MTKSNIEWTQETWNPIVGCSILSPGCTNCYAMGMAARIEAMNAEAYAALEATGMRRATAPQYDGTTRKVNGNAVWTGKFALAENTLLAPLKRKKPTTYFVNSMGDLFHESCPDEWIDTVFAVMALTPQHTYQVLTKRAKRMQEYLSRKVDWNHLLGATWTAVQTAGRLDVEKASELHHAITDRLAWPLPNVWLGVSTERQQEADARIPLLLNTPAAVRFISAEPLLGQIDLTLIRAPIDPEAAEEEWLFDALTIGDIYQQRFKNSFGETWYDSGDGPYRETKLDWVIVGGESGPASRPMHPDWARSLRDQCAAAGVPFFFKQWGNFRPLTEIEKATACGATLVYREAEIQRGSQNAAYVLRVGKKAAGRLLDGMIHDATPGVRALQAPRAQVPA